MASPLGGFLASMVSPQVAPGSSYKGAANSLGEFGQMMQQKRQQDRYFDFQKRQYEEPRRQAALQRIQAALSNPDDQQEIAAAIAEGKKWGIDVKGHESLLSTKARDTARRTYEAAAEPDEPNIEVSDAETPSAQKGAPAGQEQGPAPWLTDYMGTQGVQSERGKQVQAETEQEVQAAGEPDPETRVVASSLPNPPPVPVKGAATLGGSELGAGLKPKAPRGVTISVNGQPYATFDAHELEGYRAKQSALVAHVFQPLLDNAADETETRAATVAQQQAVEAYNAGMSKEQAIEVGNKAWAQMINMRFKRDYNKFPPGFKFTMPGSGGGATMGEGASAKLWDKMNDNERQWVAEARNQFKVQGAQQAVADAGLIEAATHAETPLAQNQGLMRILKEMSGTAVTDPEARRFYEGIGIMGQAELLLRRLEGGDISPDIRDGVREIAGLIRNRAQESIAKAGDFVYQRIAGDTLFPGSDELRMNRARELRSLFTGEKTTPMKVGKKGKLQPVQQDVNAGIDAIVQ